MPRLAEWLLAYAARGGSGAGMQMDAAQALEEAVRRQLRRTVAGWQERAAGLRGQLADLEVVQEEAEKRRSALVERRRVLRAMLCGALESARAVPVLAGIADAPGAGASHIQEHHKTTGGIAEGEVGSGGEGTAVRQDDVGGNAGVEDGVSSGADGLRAWGPQAPGRNGCWEQGAAAGRSFGKQEMEISLSLGQEKQVEGALASLKYIHTRTHMHACIHACMHTYIHTHTHIYTNTYTYIHSESVPAVRPHTSLPRRQQAPAATPRSFLFSRGKPPAART